MREDYNAQINNFLRPSSFRENCVNRAKMKKRKSHFTIDRAIFEKRMFRGLRVDKQQYALLEHIYKKKIMFDAFSKEIRVS